MPTPLEQEESKRRPQRQTSAEIPDFLMKLANPSKEEAIRQQIERNKERERQMEAEDWMRPGLG